MEQESSIVHLPSPWTLPAILFFIRRPARLHSSPEIMARVPEASIKPTIRDRRGLPPLIFLLPESFPTLHLPNIPPRSPPLQAKCHGAGCRSPDEFQEPRAQGSSHVHLPFFRNPPNFRFLNNTLGCPALQPKYQQAGSVNSHGAQVP